LTFAYIGGISRGGTLLVMRKSAAARLNDPAAKSVVVPAVELVSTGPQMALLGKEYLGWNVRLAIGYSGTPAMILAARQGEVDAMASSSASQLKPLFEDPEFVPYTQLGDLDDVGNFVERANFRDVPLFGPMMEAKLPQDKRAVFSAWLRTQYLDKWFALPPKTPPAYVAAYRVAFNKAVNDPNFVRQARLQFGDDFKAVSADNITQLVEGMVSSADLVLNEMLELRRKHGLPTE
jgi:hypothetical protein